MSDTKATLRVINQMQADGVIGKYAIGGAVASAFYLEATSTFDIDIFIPFENVPGSSLISLSHIFNYLLPKGHEARGEHVFIEGWLVQFLPADDPLYNEALWQAVTTEVGDVKIWVMTAEHLMAIALRTGRAKDFIRLEQFVRNDNYDDNRLMQIIRDHGLVEKWGKFVAKYMGNDK